MNAFDALRAYYDAYDEEGRLLSRHGQVEYLTTMRYIEKYLRPGMRLCEIGAGTGRYSHALARMGYAVEAVELIESNAKRFRQNTRPGENVSLRLGDARDLSFWPDAAFDMTLLLGPMYHLFTEEDRTRALAEALRVTKKGGYLFAAYCIQDASILCYGFRAGHIGELITKGLLDTDTFLAKSEPEELFALTRREEILSRMARFDTETLHYVATDLATNYMRETVDAMDEATFDLYMRYHLTLCERTDMAGATHHSLHVSMKTK